MSPAFLRPFESLGMGVLLLLDGIRHMPSLLQHPKRLLEQCWFIGYATLPLVAVLSFFIGAVLALQIGYSIRQFGAMEFIGAVVGLAMVREFGPVMTAIMLAGRVGSSITAEIASMTVYQEVDALKTMNIPPARLLVTPRLAAALLIMPVLTMVSVVSGWFGGQLIAGGVDWIGLTPQAFYLSLRDNMDVKDLTDGLIKAEVFVLAVIMIACNIGFRASGGPREIGAAVKRSVVSCIIFILVLDLLVTNLLVNA